MAEEKNMSPDKSAVEMGLRLMALAARTDPKSFAMDCLEVQIVAVGWIGDTYHGFLLTPRSRTLHDAFTRFWVDRAGRIREEEVL